LKQRVPDGHSLSRPRGHVPTASNFEQSPSENRSTHAPGLLLRPPKKQAQLPPHCCKLPHVSPVWVHEQMPSASHLPSLRHLHASPPLRRHFLLPFLPGVQGCPVQARLSALAEDVSMGAT
jgi:hypothetical protein